MDASTKICVDNNGKDEDVQIDDIYGTIPNEYRKKIKWGSYGYTVLVFLYNEKRVIKLDRKINAREKEAKGTKKKKVYYSSS